MYTVLRYLSREKFEWLLSDKGIFIAPASVQSDESEGIYNHEWLAKGLEKITSLEFNKKILNSTREQMDLHKDYTFLSSWYSGSEENIEMWNQYGKNGVVIVSSTLCLIDNTPEPLKQVVKYEPVEYSDENKKNNFWNPFKYKNEKFKHEKEYRIIFNMKEYSLLTGFEKEKYGEVWFGVGSDSKPSYQSKECTSCMSDEAKTMSHSVIRSKSNGYIINYDLNKLITEIIVSPYCTDDDIHYFEKMLINAGVKSKISRSSLL